MPRKKEKGRRLNWFRLFVVLVAAGMLLGGLAAFGLVVVSLKDLPTWDPAALQPNNATLIFDVHGNPVTEIGLENRITVDIEDIPPNVKKAFLAAEDVRFYQHYGVDPRAIARAVWANVTGGFGEQGASTITQQLVKNIFLSPDKTLKRKIQEAFLAIQVERHYAKDEILQMYLNWVYFGEGAHGIEAAARTYFGKSVSELDLSEAATLAGLPKGPSIYSPYRDLQAAVNRRDTVLDLMWRYEFVSREEAEEAKAKPIELGRPATGDNPAPRYPYPHFVDHVTDILVDKYGEVKVFKEGLRVYTTIDPKIQQAAQEALTNENNYPATKRDDNGVLQPQAAMVVLDPTNGYIKAIVGGREHTQLRQWNRATRTQPQPGSAFKPIIAYGPAIEHLGMAPASVLDDIPVRYPKWTPKNYDGGYRGLLTVRTALAYSVNIPAVKTLEAVTPSRAVDFAGKLGITTLEPDRHNLAIALGGLTNGVTPLQMAGAYGAFANQGVYVEPTAITRVEDVRGRLLEEHIPVKTQAMKPTTAYLITDMLRTAVTSGTGGRAQLADRPVAGKTGTTDRETSIWFCGYTPNLVGVVWMGHDNHKDPLPRGSVGGGHPAAIWRQVMTKALAGAPVRNFPQPPGIVIATVDSKSGLKPGPLTPPDHRVTDIFARGTVPTDNDDVHVLVEICATTGRLAGRYCPDRITRVMVDVGYEVPETVKDYDLRVPTETCALHDRDTVFGPPPDFWPPNGGERPDQPGAAPDQPGAGAEDDELRPPVILPGSNRGRSQRVRPLVS
ncbi:MAG: penicillin-binding protein 1A [Bacillota bacterium]